MSQVFFRFPHWNKLQHRLWGILQNSRRVYRVNRNNSRHIYRVHRNNSSRVYRVTRNNPGFYFTSKSTTLPLFPWRQHAYQLVFCLYLLWKRDGIFSGWHRLRVAFSYSLSSPQHHHVSWILAEQPFIFKHGTWTYYTLLYRWLGFKGCIIIFYRT